jgi:hypothetical protein
VTATVKLSVSVIDHVNVKDRGIPIGLAKHLKSGASIEVGIPALSSQVFEKDLRQRQA